MDWKFILFLVMMILFLVCLNVVTAANLSFGLNETKDIRILVGIDNATCYNHITYSDGSILFNKGYMTKNSSNYYNTTILGEMTMQIGEYQSTIHCYNGTDTWDTTLSFKVGDSHWYYQWIIILIGTIIVLGLYYFMSKARKGEVY